MTGFVIQGHIYSIFEMTPYQIHTGGAGEGGGFLKHSVTAKASTS